MILDVHSHNLAASDAIISVNPADFNPQEGKLYSVGVHPWLSASVGDDSLCALKSISLHRNVVAIGESGIDAIHGAQRSVQEQLLTDHIKMSENARKPLVLHCVRSSNDIINLHRQYRPLQPWIIHGFRGNENVAQALLAEGLFLSFGERFNSKALSLTPIERLLVETDDSDKPIDYVYNAVSIAVGRDVQDLKAYVSTTIASLFHIS